MSESGLNHIGKFVDPKLLKKLKPPSIIAQRLIDSAVEIRLGEAEAIAYQHSVLCQIGMPYRNPGDDIRVWDRKQGTAHLRIEGGSALHPKTGSFIQIGLPWGPKPRLIMSFLNAEALRTGEPVIDVGRSLTDFVKRLGFDDGGRTIRSVKDQLARLSASRFLLGMMAAEDRAITTNLQIVKAFDLWFPKEENQRVLWPAVVQLSDDYLKHLKDHAVPLREAALASLSHNAMALDIYAWLAQRLHRVTTSKGQFITWVGLWDQFGHNYAHINEFRRVFKRTVAIVKTQYPDARYIFDKGGMTLFPSAPPVAKRIFAVV